MNTLIIQGIPPYDGRYDWDLDGAPLTTREWGWIKRLSGYLPLTVEFGDPEVIIVCAAIALRRAGKVQAAQVPGVFEVLADAPFGAGITLETEGEVEDEADVDPSGSSNGNSGSSGPVSPTRSETSADSRSRSGTLASATSASAQARSES